MAADSTPSLDNVPLNHDLGRVDWVYFILDDYRNTSVRINIKSALIAGFGDSKKSPFVKLERKGIREGYEAYYIANAQALPNEENVKAEYLLDMMDADGALKHKCTGEAACGPCVPGYRRGRDCKWIIRGPVIITGRGGAALSESQEQELYRIKDIGFATERKPLRGYATKLERGWMDMPGTEAVFTDQFNRFQQQQQKMKRKSVAQEVEEEEEDQEEEEEVAAAAASKDTGKKAKSAASL